jgi:hypothetical protein
MELINATRMVAGYTMGMEPSGRELLVIVVKGTFQLPKPGEEVRLHEQQLPLVIADTFTGEPGFSAPYCEVDFAPRKLRCDVLLQGSAYAPQGQPASRVPVGMRVGPWSKSFAVVGDRHWTSRLGGVAASEPEPFPVKQISYDVAFGGQDTHDADPARHAAFLQNPVGRGFHQHLKSEWIDGSPLPNTEELDRRVDVPHGGYAPMAFGPVGRSWDPRARFAGTYDQRWLDEDFPFLPRDFDDRYYQSAPLDQQLPLPAGGQQVSLVNLTADGARNFLLPDFEAPIHVFAKGGGREDLKATLDTLFFEPDFERFTMTWRVSRPLKKNMFEISQVMVGRKGREWWQQRQVAFPIPVVMVPAEPLVED